MQKLLNAGDFKSGKYGDRGQERELGKRLKESNLILIMINIPPLSNKQLHTIKLKHLNVI